MNIESKKKLHVLYTYQNVFDPSSIKSSNIHYIDAPVISIIAETAEKQAARICQETRLCMDISSSKGFLLIQTYLKYCTVCVTIINGMIHIQLANDCGSAQRFVQ